jgi:hypothetical protein
VSALSCSPSCGSCSPFNGGVNQTTCDLNSGTFNRCGIGCPSGWHSLGTSCGFTCGSCDIFTMGGVNQTTCAPN